MGQKVDPLQALWKSRAVFVPRDPERRRQVVTPASQESTAVVEGTGTSDVLLLLKTGPDMYRKWKTRVANPGESFALEVASW
jgi:hypothetical protein